MRLTDVGWSALVCTEQVQVFRTQEDYTEGRLSSFKSGKIIAGEITITVNCEPCKPSLAESKKESRGDEYEHIWHLFKLLFNNSCRSVIAPLFQDIFLPWETLTFIL